MSQKLVEVPGLGSVLLARRRGSRSLRLSVNSKGQIRVNMPPWTPYASGIAFANAHKDWLSRQLSKHQVKQFKHGDRVGKNHFLRVTHDPRVKSTSSRIANGFVLVKTPLTPGSAELDAKVLAAIEKSLKHQATDLLPDRLEQLASIHGFSYKNLRIKKLVSRWGSCSSDKTITLSIFLIQLPWNLIDYVLVHELLHTRYMNHGADFWNEFEKILPEARKIRRQVNAFQPKEPALYLLPNLVRYATIDT